MSKLDRQFLESTTGESTTSHLTIRIKTRLNSLHGDVDKVDILVHEVDEPLHKVKFRKQLSDGRHELYRLCYCPFLFRIWLLKKSIVITRTAHLHGLIKSTFGFAIMRGMTYVAQNFNSK